MRNSCITILLPVVIIIECLYRAETNRKPILMLWLAPSTWVWHTHTSATELTTNQPGIHKYSNGIFMKCLIRHPLTIPLCFIQRKHYYIFSLSPILFAGGGIATELVDTLLREVPSTWPSREWLQQPAAGPPATWNGAGIGHVESGWDDTGWSAGRGM